MHVYVILPLVAFGLVDMTLTFEILKKNVIVSAHGRAFGDISYPPDDRSSCDWSDPAC